MGRRKRSIGTELAGRTFQPDDYKKDSEVAKGLAMTHEQVSDSLTEGTIDGEIDLLNDKVSIPRNRNEY